MAFILSKGVLKEIEVRMRKFLWQGGIGCKSVDEGGLGIRALGPLNKALMSQHLWAIIQQDSRSVWVTWITTYRLKRCTVWTANTIVGSWSWRKILRQ
ncbi:UNVERIFIED_CONTAM: hypothetical protein Slati_2448700 [Sesamum latifolium]|uniref:Uncharacterized protein n=1 Tax=Sesamum latifolium TaxID=2727402 RepID=A0AAW2WDC5_9LAMI